MNKLYYMSIILISFIVLALFISCATKDNREITPESQQNIE
jgi:LAS superfamily LD-carboxypeptidase LdcB